MIEEPVFEHFGRAHLVTLAVIVGVSLLLPLWARGLSKSRRYAIGIALGISMVTYRTAYIPIVAWYWGEPIRDLLPLHICAVLQYVCAYALWKRSQGAYEIAYFWGMGGTLQALLTPEMNSAFPHYTYFSHFVPHGAILVAVLYATFALEMRPYPISILRALRATLVYAALLLPANLLLGTNFMYLLGKPKSASLLDHLGPWPGYIVVGIGVALLSYAIWYVPFWLADLGRARMGEGRPV